MPIQGTGSEQEQSIPEQVLTLDPRRAQETHGIVGHLRLVSLRCAPLRFAVFALVSLGCASLRLFSSCPRFVLLHFVPCAARLGSFKIGVIASPSFGGLDLFRGWVVGDFKYETCAWVYLKKIVWTFH